MPLRDSAPEKWIYREHTRVKHEILKHYLGGWLAILGKFHRRLCYFDCFAGRGEYEGGFDGSPVIALHVANDLVQKEKVEEVVCLFIERDLDNLNNLRGVVKEHRKQISSHVKVQCIPGEFARVISEVLKDVGAHLAPSFFFIDPFGFAGVPFDLVKNILSIQRTEIFFTFMYRDINRFLEREDLGETFDELFGNRKWQKFLSLEKSDREHGLRWLYAQQLCKEASARCTRAFRVCADEKIQTLYYLIHATNHPKGACLMKEVMHRRGTPGLFAYLGPQDFSARYQLTLLPKANDIEGLKRYLLEHFAGRTASFDQIREETWATNFIESEYRKALKELRSESKISVKPITSKTLRGLREDDEITFPPKS